MAAKHKHGQVEVAAVPTAGTSEQADHSEAPVLAAAVIQLAQSNAVDVPLPGALEHIELQTRSDTIYDLPDGTEGLQVRESGGNLMLAFPNGGVVEFSGFAQSSGVEFRTADKGMQSADDFVHDLEGHGTSGPLPPDNPLFTPGPGPEILGALSPIGPLPPTELAFHRPDGIHDVGLLLHNDGDIFAEPDNGPPSAPDGSIRLRSEGPDPSADPNVNALQHFSWNQITDTGGQPISLPDDPDGDPITIKIVSLPPEMGNDGGQQTRIDLFLDEGGTKVALQPGDVLTTDQLQNSLFSWVAKSGGSVGAQLGDLVYSVTDTHMHTVQGIIHFSLNGE